MSESASTAEWQATDPVDEAYGATITAVVLTALSSGMSTAQVLSWIRAAIEAYDDE